MMGFVARQDAFLTIITSVLNSERLVGRCITSLLISKKKCKAYKIAHLIVDGYSSDSTLEIVRQLSPSSEIVQRKPQGIFDALDFGISLTQSPYVMYLHSDDELDEDFLQVMLDEVSKYKNVNNTLFYSTVDFIDEDSKLLYRRLPPYYINFIEKFVNIIQHPNAIYPTKIEKKYPYASVLENKGSDLQMIDDHRHLYLICKELNLVRVKGVSYKFRISDMSYSTNWLRRKKRQRKKILLRIVIMLCAAYIALFETNRRSRLVARLNLKRLIS